MCLELFLTPKVLCKFLTKNTSKLHILVQSERKKNVTSISIFDHKIFNYTTKATCSPIFMKFDCTDWKIIMFKVKTRLFSSLRFKDQMTLTSLSINFLHYTRNFFYTMMVYMMLIPCIPIFRGRWGVQHIQKNCGRYRGSKIANTHFIFLWARIVIEWGSQW